ncbi:MAG: hypothetical protein GF353_24880 [Candidatus Lokiarchaeota archaeon]|nr:hypothetical protein [Candidatus Lokiarchaeota archaeon]
MICKISLSSNLILLYILIIPIKICFGEIINLSLKNLTVDDGLSQNWVRCIYQDSRGYLWFGTQGGLNRYDGYSFKIFTNNPSNSKSLSFNSVNVIYEPNFSIEQQLWIGTDHELNILDLNSNIFRQYDINGVTSFCEDDSGMLWIGTVNSGLFFFDNEKKQFSYFNDLKAGHVSDSINTICKDKNGNLWVGSRNKGMFKIAKDSSENLYVKNYQVVKNKNSISHNNVRTILADSTGVLWIGTMGGGLNQFDPKCRGFTNYKASQDSFCLKSNYIRSLYKDRYGTIWVGTDGGGLSKLIFANDSSVHFIDHSKAFTINNKLIGNSIWDIVQDESGMYWLATRRDGIIKLDPKIRSFRHLDLTEGYSHDCDKRIWSIYQDKKRDLWIGSGSCLFKLKGKNSDAKIFHYDLKKRLPDVDGSFAVRAICEDHQSNFWLGLLGSGICKFDRKNKNSFLFCKDPGNKYSLPNNNIYDIHPGANGNLWIATNGAGLVKFSINKETFKSYKFPTNTQYSLQFDWVINIYEPRNNTENILWLGTWEDGLVKFYKKTGKFTSYTSGSTRISSNTVFSICEDNKENLWLGLYGGGLNKFDVEKEIFISYTQEDGLADNVVYAVLQDQFGFLWMSTNRGISKFDPESKRFTNYDIKDGLQSSEFNLGAFCKTTDGELLFGGINGLNRFYPQEVMDTKPAKIILTDIKVFGKSFVPNTSVHDLNRVNLSYRDDVIEFEFAAIHYKNPHKNQHAYMLEGFDKKWNYVGAKREAIYTNIEPGEYVFRAKVANSDGFWNNDELAIQVIVSPPFWRSWWFYSISAILVLAVTMGIHRFLIRQAIRIEKAKQKERLRLRKKIADDFHDEISHYATKISLNSKSLRTQFNKNLPKQLENVISNADSLFREVKDYLLEIDPENSSLYDLAAELKNFGDQIFGDTSIEFRLKGIELDYEKAKLSMDWRRNIAKIFKEAMHNVLKHAQICSTVDLQFKLSKEALVIILSDDGIGFVESDIQSGRGLRNMRQRAKKIGCQLRIESKQNEGTKIHFIGKLTKEIVD